MEVPFVGGGYLGRSSNLDPQRCVNLYPELDKTGGKPECLIGTPGLPPWVTDGDLPAGGILLTPGIAPDTGSYDPNVTVTMSCATSGAVIRYTTDGSDPTGASTEYTVPIVVTVTTTIKAKAFKTGWTSSGIATEVYTIPSWTAYFDNTRWTPVTGTWDGVKWNSVTNQIELSELGVWVDGFRPTKLRFNHTNPLPLTFGLFDKAGGGYTIAGAVAYISGTEVTCTFQSGAAIHDIGSLARCYDSGAINSFSITNIEFLG